MEDSILRYKQEYYEEANSSDLELGNLDYSVIEEEESKVPDEVEEESKGECVDDEQEDLPDIDGQPLRESEIRLIREHLRMQLFMSQQARRSPMVRTKIDFKVPTEHPVFSGNSVDLEPFLMDMELSHSKETSDRLRHNPGFITKLTPYFKKDTAARTQFRMWASGRVKKRLVLSWDDLVRHLKAQHGMHSQAMNRFDDFYDLKQNGGIHDYIASKSEAALLAPNLNKQTELFGFIRGLRKEYKNYVNLQRPDTLEDAQKYAIAFENSGSASTVGKSRLSGKNSNKVENGGGSNQIENSNNSKRSNKRKSISLNSNQQLALDELRRIRAKVCFQCGGSGHRRQDCNSTEAVQQAFQAKVNALKERINKP